MNKISSIFLFLSTFVLASAADLDNDQLRIIDIIQTHPTINHLSSTVPLPVLIPSITVRLPRSCGTGGPCNLRDEKCMSNQMLKYVNDYRRTQGLSKMLTSGSSSQLSNAVSHSKKMKQRGSIYHQQISKVNLGCSTFFSGENVANNHCSSDETNTDPARLCVDQFIQSPPHRRNIVSEYHESVTMGVYVSDDGYIWCTQTFSKSTKFSTSGRCAPLKSASSSPSSSVPRQPSSTQPQAKEGSEEDPCDSFKTKQFRARIRGKSRRPKTFKATSNRGACQYCTSRGMCLSPRYSKRIDDRISRR